MGKRYQVYSYGPGTPAPDQRDHGRHADRAHAEEICRKQVTVHGRVSAHVLRFDHDRPGLVYRYDLDEVPQADAPAAGHAAESKTGTSTSGETPMALDVIANCPRGTDGANCGRPLCPACGSDASLSDKLCREIVILTRRVELILNHRSDAAPLVRIEAYGQIYGLRVALCLVMGWDHAEADKEGRADDYVKEWRDRVFPEMTGRYL